jgi:hypothetical protein
VQILSGKKTIASSPRGTTIPETGIIPQRIINRFQRQRRQQIPAFSVLFRQRSPAALLIIALHKDNA